MTQPIILPFTGNPLHIQARTQLCQDTDPTYGVVPALGNGVASIFPNFETNSGPNVDPSLCPRPFILLAHGGSRSVDKATREIRVFVEIHDDFDLGDIRWPGLLARVKKILIGSWRPTPDAYVTNYYTGLYFDSESPYSLPSETFGTQMVQVVLACRASDFTSNKGYNG